MDQRELLKLINDQIDRPIFVGRISNRVALAIGATTNTVFLSPQTVKKQEKKHRDYNLYRRAPTILGSPFILIEEPRHAIYIYHERTNKLRSYKLVVKATMDGREVYLVSIHRLTPTDVRAAFKRGTRLTEFLRRLREVGPPKNPTLRS